MTLELVVIGLGMAAEVAAWRLVVSRRASPWRVMTPTFVVLGAAAALVRRPVLASDVEVGAAVAIGVLAGVVLYVATRLFVACVGGWPVFQRQASEAYELAGPSATTAAVLASVAVVGEELFWRGLVQPRFGEVGRGAGAALTWLAFVLVNAASARLPIVAAAVVGGAVWAVLAWWTAGMLATLLCHLVWTTLMLLRPPRRARRVA